LLHRYSNRLECNEQSNTGAEKPQPAVIWLVDDVVANAAVIIVIATEHLLGPEALEGFQAIKVAGFAAPERTAAVDLQLLELLLPLHESFLLLLFLL
jgi:hypothetical protein